MVPLLDLKARYESLREAIDAQISRVVSSQQFILGPVVEAFEQAICQYTGAPHAIGMSSGTDAQLALLMALGISHGDAIITTPFTFFATAGCITRLGARPLFVDIDHDTFNLCPEKLRHFLKTECRHVRGQLTCGEHPIRGIIPVHLFGVCCDMDAIQQVATEFGLPLWEDAAQALGAEYQGKLTSGHAGCMSEAGWYSFFPAKNLGAFGDAGMLVCKDAELADKVRSIRNHGMAPQYYHSFVGGNFRLDALQAAVLQAKLPHLDAWSAKRRENAARYAQYFADAHLDGHITRPKEPWHGYERRHIYHQYVIRTKQRDALKEHLTARQIGCAIYYPVPLHLQKCFASLGYKPGDLPISEQACTEVLALPIFPELDEAAQREVVNTVADFYNR